MSGQPIAPDRLNGPASKSNLSSDSMFETLVVFESYFYRRRVLRRSGLAEAVAGTLVAATVHVERASVRSPWSAGLTGPVGKFDALDWTHLAQFELALRGQLDAAKAWLAEKRDSDNTPLRDQTEQRLKEAKEDLVRCWIFNAFNASSGFFEESVLSHSHFHGLIMAQRWEPLGRSREFSIFGRYTMEGVVWTYRRQVAS